MEKSDSHVARESSKGSLVLYKVQMRSTALHDKVALADVARGNAR